MKKFSRPLTLIACLVIFLTMSAFMPLPQDPGGLAPELVVVLSAVIIPFLIQGLKWASAWFGVIYTEKALMIICFGVALVVAFVWIRPVLPPLPASTDDPSVLAGAFVTYAGALLSLISSIFGLATLLYQFILKKVFAALKIGNKEIKAFTQVVETPGQ